MMIKQVGKAKKNIKIKNYLIKHQQQQYNKIKREREREEYKIKVFVVECC